MHWFRLGWLAAPMASGIAVSACHPSGDDYAHSIGKANDNGASCVAVGFGPGALIQNWYRTGWGPSAL